MKYSGEITMMSEQGCGAWPQFHDYRGLHGANKEFWSWNWTINFNKDTKIKNLKIWDDDANLIYNDSWSFGGFNKYHLVYPKEVDSKKWFRILGTDHKKCEIECDEILPSDPTNRNKE
jgi:hypothetical protein